MTTQMQSQTATTPHKYSYLPIPTESEMEEIIDLIYKHKDNPQLLKKMEEITPPHIMKVLVEFAERRADEAEQWAREVKELEESINKRLGLQKMN